MRRQHISQPAEYHIEPSSPPLFPSLPPSHVSSFTPSQPDFGVSADTTQALPIYKLHSQDSCDNTLPTYSESIFPECPSISTYSPHDVDRYGFSRPPPIPDYGEVVPNPYIQQEIDRSMVPLDVNSNPYEQPSVCHMIGINSSPAVPITHSSSLPQYTPPPHTQSVPKVASKSGIGGVLRSVSRAFSRLNRKHSNPASPQSPPLSFPAAPAPSRQYNPYVMNPTVLASPAMPAMSAPPAYSSYPVPPRPVQQVQPQYCPVPMPPSPQVAQVQYQPAMSLQSQYPAPVASGANVSVDRGNDV